MNGCRPIYRSGVIPDAEGDPGSVAKDLQAIPALRVAAAGMTKEHELEEIEKEIAAEIDGRRILLRYWAINYGTHVGSTIKMIDAANNASIVELSFETHWNAAGRYILRIGGVKENSSYPNTGAIASLAGANVLKKLADLFSTAKSLDEVFARVKANVNALLWAAGVGLVEA